MGAKRTWGVSIVCAAVALLLSASAAEAAARFASPSGSGTACTQASPCDVTTAVNSASNNDDVTIESGTYSGLTTGLTDNVHTLTIHGQAGAPRPVLSFATAVNGFLLHGFGTSVSDVEVDVAGALGDGIAVIGGPVTIDHVLSHVLGADAGACVLQASTTLTNSVCVADGSGPAYALAVAAVNQTVTLRNDTLESPGGAGATGGIALNVNAGGGKFTTALLTNVIARGAQADLLASTDSNASSSVVITADHSNYSNVFTMNGGGGSTTTVTPAGSGTNQTAAPNFASPGMDDFHEVAGSPTIGAGISSPANGMSDLDGNPRQVNGATDIGAYQFIAAPTCQPLTTTAVFGQATSVQLHCTDVVGTSLSYAIVSNPAHGSVSVNGATGQATYTAATGYSGPDSFTFDATSSHGTSAATTATITVPKPQPPRDSQPKLSPPTFAALSGGPSAVTATVKGTIISYTDTEAATTTFVVRQPTGKGVLSHGRCVKTKPHEKTHGKSCVLYKTLGLFRHGDKAGKNRFRFTGRIHGRKLRPGRYLLLSTPRNSTGESGKSHTNTFTIKL
jgi:Bacterial Ig domain